MAKMYYSESEAIQRLGIAPQDLDRLLREGKLRAYADGTKRMFKVSDVDALAGPSPADSGEIELTPADTAGRDAVSLSEADKGAPPSKEDTVITTEGISIFDDEDLEVEVADPMAKTTIAPSVEQQASVEGAGSGSGLLDLTREPDDTSLGAVLEDISVESAVGSSAAVEAVAEEPAREFAPAMAQAPTFVEALDPGAGAFSGLVLAACLVMLVAGAVAVAAMFGALPRYLQVLQENLVAFLGASAAVAIVLALAGYFIGKSVADRATALQRGGAP